MNSRTGRIFLLGLVSAILLMAQTACSSQNTAPADNQLATASPTPDAAMIGTSPTDSTAGQATGQSGGAVASNASSGSSNPGAGSPGSNVSSTSPSSTTMNKPAAPPPPTPTPHVVTLAAGKPISVWTTSTITTKTAKSGDKFVATLANPIVDGDWVVAKKGATVEGTIIDADQGGRVKGVASLSLRLDRLTLADGRTVNLDTSRLTREAKSTKKKDAAKVGIGAGIGAAIGAIAGGGKGAAIGAGAGGAAGGGMVMATKGDPAVIGSETQLTFRLTSPVTVTKR